MRYILSMIFFLALLASPAFAQNLHERTWFFGAGNAIHFDNGIVVNGGIPPTPPGSMQLTSYGLDNASHRTSIAVSDVSGQLRFFVQIRNTSPNSSVGQNIIDNAIKVFDRNGNPFTHGNIRTAHYDGNSYPSVIPHPGDMDLYYLIYSHNSALFYSLVDMSLNNGFGDIVAKEKDVPLTGYGEVVGIKTTTVRGCNRNVWLIARSRIANRYLSFEVNPDGINTTPVISEIGTGKVTEYFVLRSVHYGGLLKASNDGKTIAAGTNEGIELYDFEPCSGRLKNARIIDTVPAMGLCFSPDDSKLYASYNKWWRIWFQGEIYQYDLTAGDLSAIAASRTLVMRNPIYEYITVMGPAYDTGPLGAMKIGLDGKLYVSKNIPYPGTIPCSVYNPTSANSAVPSINQNCYRGQYMHVIHDPDLPGTSCNAELDFLKLNDQKYDVPSLLLQLDITPAIAAAPDTLPGETIPIINCFRDLELLHADTTGSCYYWDDGSSDSIRQVVEPGTYWVRYFKDCSVQMDTFIVDFIELPDVPLLEYACPGEASISVDPPEGSKWDYSYVLRNSEGSIVDSLTANTGFTLSGLDTGLYQLQIFSGPCDTTLTITINAYPTPDIKILPGDTTVYYGDQVKLTVDGASIYAWWPSKYLDTTNATTPTATPLQPTEYVVLGINDYGCRDTGRIFIDIDYSMPQSVPNAFSPNGDGLNDQFSLQGIRFQKLHAFRIYNRYGNLIFETRNPKQGWDGSFKGQPCETGTYFYYVEIVRPDGQVTRLKGEVMLLR